MKFRIDFPAARERLISPRAATWVVGKGFLIAGIILALESGDRLKEYHQLKIAEVDLGSGDDTQPDKGKKPFESYNVILNRDMFGQKKSGGADTTSAPKTQLKFKLLGTNVSPANGSYAIILDEAKKEEGVFGLHEMVFQQAKLIEVRPDSVIIEHDGKKERLSLDIDTGQKKSATGDSDFATEIASDDSAPPDDQTDFTVPEEEVTGALNNLPLLLSQARAVPFFRNGQSIGMRLFAIRKGSLYEKLGLKNGDVIKGVNDALISDPAQALKLFEQLKSERNINVKVERNGADTQLNYSVR